MARRPYQRVPVDFSVNSMTLRTTAMPCHLALGPYLGHQLLLQLGKEGEEGQGLYGPVVLQRLHLGHSFVLLPLQDRRNCLKELLRPPNT